MSHIPHPLVGEVIKAIKSQGMTINAACVEAGISPAVIYRWTSGETAPNLAVLSRLLTTVGFRVTIELEDSISEHEVLLGIQELLDSL